MSQPPGTSPGPAPARKGACPCERCRRRGLFGPVLLITIGGLFLADEVLPGVRFRDLWPVILIAVGVLMFLANTASTEGHRG